MKNLKKLLALVLVVAMVLSVGAISASAAFTDTTKSNYQEAIEVLAGIGVINGTTSTTFEPNGSLDRASAAKIITYMLLGPYNAAMIKNASAQKFSDVPTSHWASGYIEYCASQGIISGTGDGKFNPNGTLKTVEFTKMLLVALGYNAQIEGYVGSNWAINIASDALTAGVSDYTIPISASTTCTREQAAQLAFKTLTAKTVYYDGGSTITVGGTTITTGATLKYTVGSAVAAENYNNYVDNYEQFCEKHFGLLKLTNGTNDLFGRPAHDWANNATLIGSYKDKAVKSYNGSMGFFASTIASDLNGYKLKDNSATPVSYSVDNVTTVSYTGAAGVVVSNGVASALSPAATTTAAAIAGLTGNGKLVEVYADYNKNITKIVVVEYTVDTISNVVTTSDRTTYSLTSGSYVDYTSPTVTDTIYGQTGMVKGDIVTRAVVGSYAFVYPTTKVVGIATEVNSMGTVTVGGTAYPIGTAVLKAAGGNVAIGDYSAKTVAFNYYLDQFGFVVATTAAAGSTNYVYLLNKFGELKSDVNGTLPSAQVKVVKTDGTVAAYTLKLTMITAGTAGGTADFNGTPVTLAAGDYIIAGTDICVYDVSAGASNTTATVAAAVNTLDNVYAYTLADTTITLESMTAPAAGSMTVGNVYNTSTSGATLGYGVTSATAPNSKTILVGSNTVYVVYFTDLKTTAIYTGSVGLPQSAASLSGDVVMTASAAAAGTASYVFVSTTAFSSVVTQNYAYINTYLYTTSLDNTGATVYTYSGTKADGKPISLKSTAGALTITDTGVYTYNADETVSNSNELIGVGDTTATDHTAGYIYDGTLEVIGSLLGVSDTSTPTTNYYNITSDTKIVYIDPSKGSIDGNKGCVILARDSAGAVTTNVATIYVVG